MVIGAVPDMEAETGKIRIVPGDRLFVFSDGVFELKTTAGEMWDFDEFQEFMSRPLGLEEDRIDELRAKGRELMGSEQFEDDFSILEIDFH
jgi:sigma-B regulation protein RsbU (phosphoserine phosphatase)